MRHGIKKRYLLLLLTAFLIVTMNAIAEPMKLSLNGKVLLITSSGMVPLKEAAVELISLNTGKVVYRTYTDSSGDFAFYNVPEGGYEIQVLFGGKVMKQQVGNEVKERNSVKIFKQAYRVSDISVLP